MRTGPFRGWKGPFPTCGSLFPKTDGKSPNPDGSRPYADRCFPWADRCFPYADGFFLDAEGFFPYSDGSSPMEKALFRVRGGCLAERGPQWLQCVTSPRFVSPGCSRVPVVSNPLFPAPRAGPFAGWSRVSGSTFTISRWGLWAVWETRRGSRGLPAGFSKRLWERRGGAGGASRLFQGAGGKPVGNPKGFPWAFPRGPVRRGTVHSPSPGYAQLAGVGAGGAAGASCLWPFRLRISRLSLPAMAGSVLKVSRAARASFFKRMNAFAF